MHTPLATARLAAFAAFALSSACAHAPSPARALPEVSWPAAPEAPRVALAGILPDPSALPRRPFWRRALDAIAGIDHAERVRSLLARPFGIALAADGTVLTADPDEAAVLAFAPDGRAERIGCRSREWSAPMAIALGETGALVVADAGAAEIVVRAADGTCRAVGAGALERPTGVALDGDRLLVADPPRHQVVLLSAAGEVLGRWGAHGEGDGQFNFPTSVARTADGWLVVDALNFRIVRLSRDGRWLGTFGSAGEEGAGFARPKAIAVDEDGRVYVSDAQRDLVLVFRGDGTFEYALGMTGTEPGAFSLPAGVAVRRGRLLVADSHNRRIQIFRILGASS